jgi:hypothetical protein
LGFQHGVVQCYILEPLSFMAILLLSGSNGFCSSRTKKWVVDNQSKYVLYEYLRQEN